MKDFINAFFSGLSQKEKNILYIACGFVCLALFDRMIVGPILRETSFLQEKIDSQTTSIKRNLMILNYKDNILDKYVMFGKYFAKEDMTQEERIAELLNEVEELADRSNIALTNINPVNVEEKGEQLVYRLTVECMGTMSDFVDFIYGVDGSQKLMRVISFSLNPKDRDNYEVKATLALEKLIIFPFEENFFQET